MQKATFFLRYKKAHVFPEKGFVHCKVVSSSSPTETETPKRYVGRLLNECYSGFFVVIRTDTSKHLKMSGNRITFVFFLFHFLLIFALVFSF